jgi:hypothetical protein
VHGQVDHGFGDDVVAEHWVRRLQMVISTEPDEGVASSKQGRR